MEGLTGRQGARQRIPVVSAGFDLCQMITLSTYLSTGNRFPGNVLTPSSSRGLHHFPHASGDVTYVTRPASPAFTLTTVLALQPPGDATQTLLGDRLVTRGTFSEKLQNHSSRPSVAFSRYHTEFGNNVSLNFTPIKGSQSSSVFQFAGWL